MYRVFVYVLFRFANPKMELCRSGRLLKAGRTRKQYIWQHIWRRIELLEVERWVVEIKKNFFSNLLLLPQRIGFRCWKSKLEKWARDRERESNWNWNTFYAHKLLALLRVWCGCGLYRDGIGEKKKMVPACQNSFNSQKGTALLLQTQFTFHSVLPLTFDLAPSSLSLSLVDRGRIKGCKVG